MKTEKETIFLFFVAVLTLAFIAFAFFPSNLLQYIGGAAFASLLFREYENFSLKKKIERRNKNNE